MPDNLVVRDDQDSCAQSSEMVGIVEAQFRKWCEYGCIYPQTCRCRKMAVAAVGAIQQYLSGLPNMDRNEGQKGGRDEPRYLQSRPATEIGS